MNEYGIKIRHVVSKELSVRDQESERKDLLVSLRDHAERGGLIDPTVNPRMDDLESFMMDIWDDNPLTLDLVGLNAEFWPPPSMIEELGQVEEILLM